MVEEPVRYQIMNKTDKKNIAGPCAGFSCVGTSPLNMLFKIRLTIFHNHPQDLNLGSLQLVSQAAFSLTLPQAYHFSVADQILLVELKIVHQDES